MPSRNNDSPTICIVDDDAELLSALKFAMEIDGFTVNTYADAGSLLQDRRRAGCNCLVVDHRLPEIDGLALIERLKSDGAGVPAILITTNPTASVRARARAIGVPIVEKPLLRDDLTDAVRKALADV